MTDRTPSNARDFALDVVRQLREAGYEALWAGGSVRDMLLGRDPLDYDVATSAKPDEVRRLFGRRRTVAVGAAFGVIIVVGPKGAGQVEVATFRRDATYSDGRHPDSVSFSTAEEDARRRDFTINGLFYDPIEEKVIDYVDGRPDLERGVVRAIGDPYERIAEDKLRMLRAVRFTATFNFHLNDATFRAVRENATQIKQVSAERIAEEMRKMLVLPRRSDAVRLLLATGLLAQILPECRSLANGGREPYPASGGREPYLASGGREPAGGVTRDGIEAPDSRSCVRQNAEVARTRPHSGECSHGTGITSDESVRLPAAWQRVLAVLETLAEPTFPLALAAILREMEPPDGDVCEFVETICRRWRLSVDEIRRTTYLVENESRIRRASKLPWPQLQRLLVTEGIGELLVLADAVARVVDGSAAEIDHCRDKLRLPPETLNPPPLISGDDLIARGLKPGKVFKTLLDAVRDAQLMGEVRDKQEALLLAERLSGES